MKHIKPYKIFESQEQPQQHPSFPETEEEIHELCKKYKIENYTINDNLTIDVDGDVKLQYKKLKNFTYLPLKFNKVTGHFNCANNELKSLQGGPHTVGGDFNCCINKLESLQGVPHTVGGDFNCSSNNLTSLKNGPKTVGGDFNCCINKLESLQGVPHTVGGYFNCYYNNIMSLDYLPSGIDYTSQHTRFDNNPIYSIVNTFIKNEQAEDLIQEFNDYDIVRGDKVVLGRLEVFISDFDLDMPNLDEVKEYYEIV